MKSSCAIRSAIGSVGHVQPLECDSLGIFTLNKGYTRALLRRIRGTLDFLTNLPYYRVLITRALCIFCRPIIDTGVALSGQNVRGLYIFLGFADKWCCLPQHHTTWKNELCAAYFVRYLQTMVHVCSVFGKSILARFYAVR